MALRNEEVLRESYMTKRSQNKSRFGPTNWKERWFILTPHHIIYYDGDRHLYPGILNGGAGDDLGRKKEKGRIDLARVEAVEKVDFKVFERDFTFQLAYRDEEGDAFVLYVAAWNPTEQDLWIEHVRSLVADNVSLSSHVHPGAFLKGQWSCCRGAKEATPCEPASWIPNNNPIIVQSTPPPLTTSQSNGTMMPRKVVVALYDYNAAQTGDLCLRKNEEFDVLDDSEEHWWKMRDNQGREGYAPSNYVREKGSLGLQQHDWFLGDASRQRAEAILMREEKEGCFVVRNSTTNSGIYTLSVFSKMSRVQVKHYHIKTDSDGLFYLSNSIKCATIPELIYRHQHNPGGLCTRLRNPPSQGRQAPTTAGLSHDKWEIVPSELNLLEELGSGQFGVVRHGKLYGIDVAVKMMKEGTMSEDEFIEEAKVMTKLQHPNLVQLYGVCRRKRPIYIVTEYLKHGSLLNYLRNKEKALLQKMDVLLDMCSQVCEGMAYLEGQKFIHRDLAARNCLVGSNNVIKVGDFGLARYVVDDEYTGSGGAKFPIKWAAPEVLNYMRFSSKSDVWAFGVLMWEVFTCGKMPYGRHKNAEVVEMVQEGKILDRPRFCPIEVYEAMRKCWIHSQEQRPGFHEIRSEILKVVKAIAD